MSFFNGLIIAREQASTASIVVVPVVPPVVVPQQFGIYQHKKSRKIPLAVLELMKNYLEMKLET
jgi:hypothetical protein